MALTLSHDHIAQGLNRWTNYIGFQKTEHLSVLLKLRHKTIAIFAGNRGGKCQSYQTLIETPSGEISIGELYEKGKPFEVYAFDGEKKVVAQASAPFRKQGLHECYRITMADGRWVEPADFHQVLTSLGWSSVLQLYSSFSNLQESNSGTSLSVRDSGVVHLSRKVLDSESYCHPSHRLGDGQLLPYRDTAQVFVPSQADVQQHASVLCKKDGRGNKYTDSLLTSLCHLSIQDVGHPLVGRFFDILYDFFRSAFGLFPRAYLASGQQSLVGACGPLPGSADHRHQTVSFSYSPPELNVVNSIVSVSPIGCQAVYDMTVEKYANYFAGGLIHHNTSNIAYQYVKRLLGQHPVGYRNVLMRKVRCMSSSLPENAEEEETDNAQYTELKKLIPPELIERDITARSSIMVVKRPEGLNTRKTVFEFRSSKQELQDLGKINLSSLWHDEETPKDRRGECVARLIGEDGDEFFSLTATNPYTYTYDEIFGNASLIYKTKTITDKLGGQKFEVKDSGRDIACIFMATDDNPTLTPEAIERLFENYTDPDECMVRRYAVFKQVSGRIHKSYDPQICYIDYNKYFPNGIPYKWIHARGIDYHESRLPWSVGWLGASPENEWFLWQEFHPAIDGPNAYSTYDIVMAMARKSGDYYYTLNLIDALANKTQANTNTTVTSDINRHFQQIRRDTGLGTDTMFQGWNTKGETGRNEIKMRFKNAVRCGKPFNNSIKERGTARRLPTLWICNTCPQTNKSLINWRFQEHILAATKAVNDPKVLPQQKWSHDCMVLECLAKSRILLNAASLINSPPRQAVHQHRSITGR